ncbi:MAG: TldD/PmbA family protein [Gammaproteobacteria bacterium]|nr:MAG: TldD/PmbA family protein [Gammaproteobacteria bacterium]
MSLPSYAERVLEQVRRAGAEGDLIVDESESLGLKARDGELEEQSVSATRMLGLRVIRDERVGIAYSEAGDEAALDQLVEQALLNAGFNQHEPHERIPDHQQTLTTDDAMLCPDSGLDIEQRIELALYLERTLAGLPKIRNVPYNGVSEHLGSRRVFSTRGLQASSRQRVNMLYAYALAAEGELTAMAGHGQVVRNGADLKADPVIEQAHRQAVAMLHGKPVPSRRYDVIFDVEAQHDLFGAFATMLSGKSAQDGINPWRERIGEVVASSDFHLSDHPHHLGGFGYQLFDAEGTATRETPLVVGGVLQTLLHNTATASHLGTHTTGHAQRSPRSALGVAAHQLVIAAGRATQGELTSGEYLELTDLQGVHSGANAISGDFSFGVSGYLCREGTRIAPVRGVTVAGNFYQMLKQIAAIGDTQHWNWQRTALMPTLRFAELAISG